MLTLENYSIFIQDLGLGGYLWSLGKDLLTFYITVLSDAHILTL